MADTDAIIIGSGHNGLIAAFRLARAGWRVTVLERAKSIGGAIRTESVTRPGFRHDLYATNLTLFKSSLVYRQHEADFARAGLRFITCHEAFASAYAGGKAMRIYTDAVRTEAEFAKCSSHDLAGWRSVVSLYKRVAPHVLPFTNMPLPSGAAIRQALRMLAALRTDVFKLPDVLFASSRRFVDRYFHSDDAKGVLVPWSFHLDLAPDIKGGAAFAFVSAASAHLNGLVVAEGGAEAIVSALRRLIEEHGGTIHTLAEVSEVLIESNRAVGVRTSDGGTITASHAVIANVTPRLLFGRLLSTTAIPGDLRDRAARFRYGPGVFMVHLALSRPIPWTNAEDLFRFNYIHLNGRPDEIARTYAQCTRGLLPERPMMVVAQPSHVDPSRAPAGCAAVRLQVRAVPANITGDAADVIRERDWQKVKEAYADRMISQLAEHAPDIEQSILGRYVMSPDDFQRENPNLIGGDCVSGSHHLDQNYFSRPFRGCSCYRTPIERLYMVGASTWPGGGVNGASGFLVAEDVLKAKPQGTRRARY